MAKKVRGHRANKPNDSFGTVNSEALYKGKYREEVYQEDEENNEEMEASEEGESEAEEQKVSEEQPENFAEAKTPEPDYKKRYDDLKRHYDERLEEWKKEKEEFVTRLNTSPPQQAEDTSGLSAFKDQYPDVYDAINKISASQSEARMKGLEEELSQIKEREKSLEKQKAYQELLRLQPDFDDLKSDDAFNDWLSTQPSSISDGVYNNSTDAMWASRVVDLYKADTGTLKKAAKKTNKSSDAAMSVSKVTSKEVATDKGEKRIWKASQIGKMKPWEFEKMEAELDAARAEGRIDFNS